MNGKNEQTAWSCFANTGRVQDYLIYTQCKQQSEAVQEVPYADQYGRTDYNGEEHWGK